MLKKIQSVVCLLLAVSMLAALTGCGHTDTTSEPSDVILGSEIIGTSDIPDTGSGGDGEEGGGEEDGGQEVCRKAGFR